MSCGGIVRVDVHVLTPVVQEPAEDCLLMDKGVLMSVDIDVLDRSSSQQERAGKTVTEDCYN